MLRRRPHAPLTLVLLSLLLPPALCQNTRSSCTSQPRLVCNLAPTKGHRAHGKVVFTALWRPSAPGRHGRCVVRVVASVSRLRPGRHAFHIHAFGDLSAADATSAGSHFSNPRGAARPHGLPNDRRRHWGDFGSLVVRKNRIATYRRVDRVISIAGILGRGMVVHELPDMGSAFQPTGAAGARQAACVIGVANPALL